LYAGRRCRDACRIVLTVGVDLHGDLEAVLERIAEAGSHRAADPEVEGENSDSGSGPSGLIGGPIARTVIDDEHARTRQLREDLGDDVRHGRLFIERRYDHQQSSRGRIHDSDPTEAPSLGPSAACRFDRACF